MGWSDHGYSRLIRLLRVVLPLGALALLSVMFLFWEGREPVGGLTYSETDIEALLRLPRMSAPAFTGVTSDGAAMRLTADSAESEGPGLEEGGTAARPKLLVVTADGTRITAEAAEARLDARRQTLLLSGGFAVNTGLGYHVAGDAVIAALDKTRIESFTPVSAQGPQGDVAAGRFQLTRSPDGEDAVVHFKGGVKLIYLPQPEQAVP